MTATSRREFLIEGGMAVAGAALLTAGARVSAYPLDGVLGVQSFDVRQLLNTDLDGTLKQLAGFGVKALDLVWSGAVGEASTKQYRQSLDAAGMVCHNAHVPQAAFQEDNWKETLVHARELGVKEMVCQTGRATNADDYKRVADTLNGFAARTKQEGIQLGWHNHGEFRPIDGQVPFDVLLKGTDPTLVKFQFDVGNAAQAGADPLMYLTTYPDRYYSLHVKDVKDGRIGIAVGEGSLDFKKLFAAAKAANIHNYDIETGAPGAVVMEKIRLSAEYLRDFTL